MAKLVYILCVLISLQSCIINKISSIQDASQYASRRLKIETIDNHIYIVRWIEFQGDKIVSTMKTKRTFVEKKDIDKIMLIDPTYSVTNLDSALNHKGTILVRTIKFGDNHPYNANSYNHEFFKIRDNGDFITGYEMTGKDTTSVAIPINQIKKVKEINKTATFTWYCAGIAASTAAIVYISKIESPSW